jgi:hypothetical protein
MEGEIGDLQKDLYEIPTNLKLAWKINSFVLKPLQ